MCRISDNVQVSQYIIYSLSYQFIRSWKLQCLIFSKSAHLSRTQLGEGSTKKVILQQAWNSFCLQAVASMCVLNPVKAVCMCAEIPQTRCHGVDHYSGTHDPYMEDTGRQESHPIGLGNHCLVKFNPI